MARSTTRVYIASPFVSKLMSQLGRYKVVTKVARFASSQCMNVVICGLRTADCLRAPGFKCLSRCCCNIDRLPVKLEGPACSWSSECKEIQYQSSPSEWFQTHHAAAFACGLPKVHFAAAIIKTVPCA